jgi:hypothetical protein
MLPLICREHEKCREIYRFRACELHFLSRTQQMRLRLHLSVIS